MPNYSHDYDGRNYNPAAPIVEIGIANPGASEPVAQLIALVDSGADASMMPINVLRQAGGRYVATRQMRGVSGHAVTVDMYLTTLFVGSFALRGIEAIAIAENGEAIIGRDALNQMVVTLNGLAGVTELSL